MAPKPYLRIATHANREPLGTRPWLRWPVAAPIELQADPESKVDLHKLLMQQASRTFSGMRFPWCRALCSRARSLIRGDVVEPWPQWRAATVKPTWYWRLPAFPELSHLGYEDLVTAVATLRGRFMWLNVRRQRMYERPVPLYLLDPLFCQWIRALGDDVVAAFAARHLGDSAAQDRVNIARARLALLRPMPLDLLTPFHAYQCQHADALAGCETEHDICLEYAALYLAIHGCRALAASQRATALYAPPLTSPFTDREYAWMCRYEESTRQDPRASARSGGRNSRESASEGMQPFQQTPFPAASKVRQVHADGRVQWPPDAVDLQALPEPVVHKLLALVKRGKARTAEPLTWRVVVGPKCLCCRDAEAADPEAGPPASLPPYRAGCACEVIFDPENDPFIEAPWDEDMALRRDVARQSMRMVLAAIQAA